MPIPQWPDPQDRDAGRNRDEQRQGGKRARKRPRRRRRGTVWRPDIARLLEGAPRSEAVIAEQVLDDMASMVGLGSRQRRSLSFYNAFRAGQRFGDKLAGGVRDSETISVPDQDRSRHPGNSRAADRVEIVVQREDPPLVDRPEKPVPAAAQHSQDSQSWRDLKLSLDPQPSQDTPETPAETRMPAWERPGPWQEIRSNKQTDPNRDYEGMALQLAQAISERVPIGDPVHHMDMPYELQALVWAADKPGSGTGPVLMTDDEVLKLVAALELENGPHAALVAAVGTALAKGPVDDIDDLRRERTAILEHLEDGQAGRFAAKDFVPRFRVFTHTEVHALHTPDVPLPRSLPDYSHEQRLGVANSLQNYVDAFTRERKDMEQENLLKAMALGDVTLSSLREINEKFSMAEMDALQDPSQPWPDSLPKLSQAMRKNIAAALARVAREGIPGPASGTADVMPQPKPEPAAKPKPQIEVVEKYRKIALQMACAVTHRFDGNSPLHHKPLQAHVSQLLAKAAARTGLPQEDVDKLAREIARDRQKMDLEDRSIQQR